MKKFYGRFEVLSEVEPKNGNRMVLCRCTCKDKTEKVVNLYSLISGKSQSCGCLQKERVREANKKNNKFEEHEDCYYVYNSKKDYFIIDKDDYKRIKDFTWIKDNYGYWYTSIRKNNKKYNLKVHRFIMNETNSKIEIDHINHCKNDNRKSNLRRCTHNENSRNVSKRENRDVIGVTWYKRDKKWESFITYKQKHIFLGRYENKDDAIKARLQAEKEYFGEFASLKHLFEKYGI